ncbi:condensation domain-containing protein [Streptomyces sp. NBC_01443]|uniref:condensation domain-containing protein n=1 Tax=Streptomyces sp. NBC_01443 TaxID=2903868 RepID=UPI00225369AD|nr:condensation domain-containing protein [Streptomyces sp. NBC_01443]MCX4633249.1 condensation domain-containing protein [Streptomyces sp. NBC_01443]
MSVAMTVVIAPGFAPALDLRGPLDQDALAAALAALPSGTHTLRRHTATHHTLHLPPHHSPAGAVADLLTAPRARPRQTPAPAKASRTAWESLVPEEAGGQDAPGTFDSPAVHPAGGLPASARQRDVLLDVLVGRPGAGLHVEQLHWRWYGPLDTGRFHAAWQAVFLQEPVLRAAFTDRARTDGPGTAPRVAVHRQGSPQLVRHHHGSADWHSLLVSERLRAFDLHRPGLLRIALLDEQAGPAGPTRILLTYHHAMLDGWSVRLLLRAFYRAYLAEGRTTGGERRPDVRDHLRWLGDQDLTPPRDFWSAATPPAGSRTLPGPTAAGLPAGDRARWGHGLARQRLTPYEAARLRDWAAGLGATESTALHAAWALLLYRDGGSGPAPAPVAFGMAVSGRGIALEGAASIPAPLRGALPVHVDVDPKAPMERLLADLRDRALGAAAYEWVSAGQVHQWSGRAVPDELTDSVVAFEAPQGPPPAPDGRDPLWTDLDAEGVRVDLPQAVGPHTPQPIAIGAYHDAEGALLLTAVNDRTRIADPEAAAALARTARLLREFPVLVDGTTGVGEVLHILDGLPVPGPVAPAPVPPGGGLRTLRAAARPDAGTILLVPPPAATEACYDALVQAYPGPEALTTVTSPTDTAACLAAVRPALAAGEPLLLGCFSGGGSVAYEVAQRIAAHGWLPPLVAIAGTADGSPASVRDLARTLEDAAGRPG